ncbi:possible phosphohydrolase [Weissella oryzae SG25]|uniref:Possible phosphohydrolase n=1 Tax=Weissella oryzae (strain DSM 25784 / JCM 18191 / LMG 30913 / SG25) TaxID=1329250 RepID=A0A069CY94_WEIOS|nr:metallophosphoesterase [Weissella oryzae]GAK30071.1 possible phosphohydrolase [Weissella oryzae SG25]
MRIAISSDNHLDINKVDITEVLEQQAQYLLTQKIDIYLIAGDLFNDFNKSLAYVRELQTLVGLAMQVRFIAGNHDMGRGIDFEELESSIDPLYLHNKSLDVPGTDWRIIGNNGWYDYLFAKGVDPAAVATFRRGLYYDRQIKQPMTDYERMDLVLSQTKTLLDKSNQAQKKVLLFTHFAPIDDDILYPVNNPRWLLVNGVLGSPRLGELIERYENVHNVYYGHIHISKLPRQHQGVSYYNPSVGYNHRRLREWTKETFLATWQDKLAIKVLTK